MPVAPRYFFLFSSSVRFCPIPRRPQFLLSVKFWSNVIIFCLHIFIYICVSVQLRKFLIVKCVFIKPLVTQALWFYMLIRRCFTDVMFIRIVQELVTEIVILVD